MKWHNHKLTSNQVGLKYGFRSGLEIAISKELDLNKVKYEFETIKLKYTVPEKVHTYTPDFYLKEKEFFIETKGLFTSADRKKMRFIKEQHPKLDIRFVFENSKRKLSKGAKSRYYQWCNKYDFDYYDRIIPEEWLKEKGKDKHPTFIKFNWQKIKRRYK
jgi:hypothetical protein